MESNQPQPMPQSSGHWEADSKAEGAKVSADPGSDYLVSVQIDPKYEDKVDADRLDRLAVGVLKAEGVAGPLEVGVVVTTDQEVRALNKQYLGHDFDTDVISFSMADEEGEEFVTPAERPPCLGDIVISYDRAAEQAPQYGNSTEQEVATLLVHGLLHLLGYNDLEEADREKMHARQNQLIADFGS